MKAFFFVAVLVVVTIVAVTLTTPRDLLGFALGLFFGLLASLPAVALVNAAGRRPTRTSTGESTTWAAPTLYVLDDAGEVVDAEAIVLQLVDG